MRLLCAAIVFLVCSLPLPVRAEDTASAVEVLDTALSYLPNLYYERLEYANLTGFRLALEEELRWLEAENITPEFGKTLPKTGTFCEPFPKSLLEYEFDRLHALTDHGINLYVFVGKGLDRWYDEAVADGVLVLDVRGIGGRLTYRLTATPSRHADARPFFCYQPAENILLLCSDAPDFLDMMTHSGRGNTYGMMDHVYYAHFRERFDKHIPNGGFVIDYDPLIETGKLSPRYLVNEVVGDGKLLQERGFNNFSIAGSKSYRIVAKRLMLIPEQKPQLELLSGESLICFPLVPRATRFFNAKELETFIEFRPQADEPWHGGEEKILRSRESKASVK